MEPTTGRMINIVTKFKKTAKKFKVDIDINAEELSRIISEEYGNQIPIKNMIMINKGFEINEAHSLNDCIGKDYEEHIMINVGITQIGG